MLRLVQLLATLLLLWGNGVQAFYTVDYGDGTSEVVPGAPWTAGTKPNIGSHTYNNAGIYTVTLTAQVDCDGDGVADVGSFISTMVVRVGNVTQQWDYGDGSPLETSTVSACGSALTPRAHTYTTPGNYTVTYTGIADSGALITDSLQVQVTGADHFDIDHDGFGIHCLGETITVTAEDGTNATIPGHTGTMTLNTQTGKGSWSLASGNGSFTDAIANDGLATYTYVAADNGVASFTLDYQEGATPVNIAVSDGSASDDDLEGTISFSPSGFTVTPDAGPPGTINAIATQTAGSVFALHLTAFGQTPANPTCGVIESYDGPKNLKFWSSYNNPVSGTIAASIDGTAIATAEGGAANQNVSFVSGRAQVAAKYKDVGSIQVAMKDDSVADPNLPNGIRGSTNPFVVKPADLVLSGIQRTSDAFANPGAADENGTVFIAAGNPFTLTVTARDSEGSTTPNYGQESVPEGVLLTPTLVAAGGVNNPPIQFVAGFSPFAAGVTTGTDFSWGEVGIIQLTGSVGDGDYLGAGDVTGTASGSVGRFIPFDFGVALNSPGFNTACPGGSFSYLGQGFTYATAPLITVTARNAAAGTTQNYAGVWWKITDAELVANGNKAYNTLAGTLDLVLVPTPDPGITDNGNGTGALAFSDGGGIAFSRAGPMVSFDAEIGLQIDVVDVDGVSYATNPVKFGDATAGNGIPFSSGKEQRYGRIAISNAHGSELLALAVPLVAQYFTATGFVTNTGDSCTSLLTTDLTLSNDDEAGQTDGDIIIGAATTTATLANTPLAAGDSGLSFFAPGAGNTGFANIEVNLSGTGANLPWLQFDWDGIVGDDNPQGRVTFGIFQGSQYFIHIREPWQ